MEIAVTRSDLSRRWAEFLYVAIGLPLGFAWVILLAVLVAVGVATAIVIAGFVLLAITMMIWRFGADLERERAALVLGHPIARPQRATADRFVERWLARVRDRSTWRDLAYMLLLGPVGVIAGGLAIVLWGGALAALVAPAFAGAAPDGSVLGDLGVPLLAAVAVGGVGLGALAAIVTPALAAGCAALATALLAPDDRTELTERITSLEVTRSGAVDSADARLRRIERDLHDGAQHRLAYIGMELGRARAKLATDPEAVDALLADAHDESKRAMRELRDLVRGIHPSVLTDRGLDAALSGLAERASVPVEIRGGARGRLPAAVETAAYYVVAETLTNAGKHAEASQAHVAIRHEDNLLVLEIGDDGKGGARRVPGSGLEGLAQRVEALDGTLEVQSPDGGPTTITAKLPCAS